MNPEDVIRSYLAAFAGDEGVLFVGKAQEKASVVTPLAGAPQVRFRPSGSASVIPAASTPGSSLTRRRTSSK